MNMTLTTKVNDLIKLLDDSKIVKDMVFLKKQMALDSNVKNLVNHFHKAEQDYMLNPSKDSKAKLITAKKALYDNKLIKSYKKQENQLYYFVLSINNKLNQLINKRLCNKTIE